ncbi:MAG: hypothetical protein LAT64_03765 [Phycisphaerales bacterium]|nr:hypothetical protein [Planctomycetota bacterium]MCH8507868.1 hypothetical protein [Phycisphaerales bacterium]
MSWLVALLVAVASGPVLLRSGESLTPEQVDGYTKQGVVLSPSFRGGAVPGRRVVPWAEVGRIEGGWGEARAYQPIADAMWRAERRLARGDASGALQLLEPLAGEYLYEHGPTSGAVASGLAAARMLRGDRPGGVLAWLAWRDHAAGPDRSWIDGETGLMPGLPPVWTQRSARAFLASLPEASEHGLSTEQASALAGLYIAAARRAAGQDDDGLPLAAPPPRLRADPGVRLVWDIVRAQCEEDAESRASARDRLRQRVGSGRLGWYEAWARLAVGASMLREADTVIADAGAAELIGVVLTHQESGPGLASLAAELAIGYFEATARPEHAATVRTMDRAARVTPSGAVGLPVYAGTVTDPEEEQP